MCFYIFYLPLYVKLDGGMPSAQLSFDSLRHQFFLFNPTLPKERTMDKSKCQVSLATMKRRAALLVAVGDNQLESGKIFAQNVLSINILIINI